MGKNKLLAFLLSIIPGVGHYYLGLMQRGLQFELLFFGLIFVMVLTGLGILALLLPVVWFYGLFDALQLATRLEEGTLPDKPLFSRHWRGGAILAGWVLIILGVFAFLSANPFFHLWSWLSRSELYNMVAAAALVGFGLYLLISRWGSKKPPEDEEVPQ